MMSTTEKPQKKSKRKCAYCGGRLHRRDKRCIDCGMPDALMMARLKWSFILVIGFVVSCVGIYLLIDFLLTRTA